MFSGFKRLIGNITLEIKDSIVFLEGVPADVIARDITKLWGTSRIEKNIFYKIDQDSFSFFEFFAVDIYYALGALIDAKNVKSNRRTLSKIRDLIYDKTWVGNRDKVFPTLLDRSVLDRFLLTPTVFQTAFFDAYEHKVQANRLNGFLLAGAAGSGKAQPLTSLVKVPGGWEKMGDLKVGDLVDTPDGSQAGIVAIYPQGLKQVWRVHFEDGRTIECCEEHLWKIGEYTTKHTHTGVQHEHTLSEVIQTNDLAARIKYSGDKVEFYVPCVTKDSVSIEMSLDRSVYDAVALGNAIPKHYLDSSHNTKIRLLRFIHAYCGGLTVNGELIFHSSRHELIDFTRELVWSLGGVAYNNTVPSGRKIRVKLPELDDIEEIVGRDKIAYTYKSGLTPERLKENAVCFGIKVTSVTSSQREVPMQCIAIDSEDHLYITNDHIVTHNTLSGLFLAEMRKAKKVIIVCPENAVNTVWEATIKTQFKTTQSYWYHKSDVPFTGKERFLIFNYAALGKLMALLPQIDLEDLVIILDESHNFNELKSLRTDMFVDLVKKSKCKDVLELSGTPIKALAVEAIPLIRCIDPLFTPQCEESFKKIYGVSAERASDMLHHRLQGLMHIVEKKELGIPLPEFQTIKVTVPNWNDFTLETVTEKMRAFTAERLAYYKSREADDSKKFYACLAEHESTLKGSSQKEEFRKYRNELSWVIQTGGDARQCKDEMAFCNRYESRELIPSLSESAKKDFKEVKAIVKYVKLKVQGECLGRVVGKIRMQACLAMAENIDYVPIIESTQKKTVMFTSFVEVIEMLGKKLVEDGLKPAFVYGKTNSQLPAIIKDYATNEDTNPLVATYPSLSTAVPLVMANVCVLLNAPWRDYILQQTVSRISRMGQDTQTYVYTATLDTGTKPNIADRALDILKWSQQQVKAITGVVSPFEIGDDLDEAGFALESFDVEEHHSVALESYEPSLIKKKQPAFAEW